MKIYNDPEQLEARNPVVTIGTFDGVHSGHKKVIARLKEIARKVDGETVIFTFYPHPRMVLFPEENNIRLLTTLDEKIALFEQAGIDHLIVFPFTREFSQLSYSDFVKQVLVDKIHTHHLVVGYDHKFGKNREGGYEFLQKCAAEYGFSIEKLDVLLINETNVSSTKIRKALDEGNIVKANRYLGYRFTLHGTVIEGQKLGRQIQFPTANVQSSDPYKIIPGHGVYTVLVRVNGQTYKGMLNIGSRPTVNTNADHRSIEVHILDFNENIYGKPIELLFFGKIRDEKKFTSLQALREQLEKDRVTTLSYFGLYPPK